MLNIHSHTCLLKGRERMSYALLRFLSHQGEVSLLFFTWSWER